MENPDPSSPSNVGTLSPLRFASLPFEVLDYLASYLSPPSLLSLSRSSRRYRAAVRENLRTITVPQQQSLSSRWLQYFPQVQTVNGTIQIDNNIDDLQRVSRIIRGSIGLQTRGFGNKPHLD